jgi:hypothetical protein
MSSKELAIELIKKLPEKASMLEIARAIEFVAGTQQAIAEFDQGESFTAEELLSRIPEWATSAS